MSPSGLKNSREKKLNDASNLCLSCCWPGFRSTRLPPKREVVEKRASRCNLTASATLLKHPVSSFHAPTYTDPTPKKAREPLDRNINFVVSNYDACAGACQNPGQEWPCREARPVPSTTSSEKLLALRNATELLLGARGAWPFSGGQTYRQGSEAQRRGSTRALKKGRLAS